MRESCHITLCDNHIAKLKIVINYGDEPIYNTEQFQGEEDFDDFLIQARRAYRVTTFKDDRSK